MKTHLLTIICCLILLALSSCGGEQTTTGSSSGTGGTGSTGGTGGSGVTPSAPMGKTFVFDIDYSSDYLPPTGEYDMDFNTGSYDLDGDHVHVPDSNGTYTFTINHSKMTISCTDSEIGKATWILTFDTSSSGTYKLTTPTDGDQFGTFALFGTVMAPIGNG